MSRRGTDKETEDRLLAVLEIDLDAEREPSVPTWSPQIGEQLIGEFLDMTSKPSQYEGKGEVPVALIQSNSGVRYAVWCGAWMLRSAMQEAKLKPGNGVAIKRLEDRDTGKKHPERRFKVVVDRNDGSPPQTYGDTGGGGQ